MSEISEFERRITAAMDRIAKGVEQLGPVPEDEETAGQDAAPSPEAAPSEDTSDLRRQLDDEKMANAQLSERLKTLRIKLDKSDAQTELATADLRAALADMDAALGQMKLTNEQLRQSNEVLRQANAEGLGDAEAVNAALAAQLAALQAERQAEAAESAALAAALDPLLQVASGADAGNEKENV
ncbi:MAG: hypothetical protein JXR13_04680 [Thalassovita sp.]